MNQRYEGKSLTAFLRVLRKIKFIFYEKLHLIGINKYPYASKNKMFELKNFLDFFHCTYSRKRLKSLSVQMSYTIITTYGKVAIKFLNDLVLKVLMDLVGYGEVKAVTIAKRIS